jgi:hypothetical protein
MNREKRVGEVPPMWILWAYVCEYQRTGTEFNQTQGA